MTRLRAAKLLAQALLLVQALLLMCVWNLPMAEGAELHGHRGARGLLPENTIEGFREAIRLGVDCIETDVGLSADGKVVIHHDRALNPDTARRDGAWIDTPVPISTLTATQLKTFDVGRIRPGTRYAAKYNHQKPLDGARIPLLSEVLAMPEFQGDPGVCLNIEIKTSPMAAAETAAPERISDALVAMLDRFKFRARVRIQSFDWRNLVHLAKVVPDIRLSFLTAEQSWLNNLERGKPGRSPWLGGIDLDDFGGSVPKAIKHLGGRIWAPYFMDIDADDVTEAHALGLKVIVWTVNAEAHMRKLLALGVDGIITDYPDVGRRVIDDWRAAKAPPSPRP